MPVIGVTGGIASGKSTATALLQRDLSAQVFDADAVARDLLENNSQVIQAVVDGFGAGVVDAGGIPDRAKLRAEVFADKEKRLRLEGILHPEVWRAWDLLAEDCRGWKCGRWLIGDIPLLYETKVAQCFDRIIVVACREEEQLRRLRFIRGLDETIARQMIAAQHPLQDKLHRGDHLIWTEGALAATQSQVEVLAQTFLELAA